jgi:hypothetical protein
MSGLKRESMPSADRLIAALRRHASELPTATGGGSVSEKHVRRHRPDIRSSGHTDG